MKHYLVYPKDKRRGSRAKEVFPLPFEINEKREFQSPEGWNVFANENGFIDGMVGYRVMTVDQLPKDIRKSLQLPVDY